MSKTFSLVSINDTMTGATAFPTRVTSVKLPMSDEIAMRRITNSSLIWALDLNFHI